MLGNVSLSRPSVQAVSNVSSIKRYNRFLIWICYSICPSYHHIALTKMTSLWPHLILQYPSVEFKYFLRLKIKLHDRTLQTNTENSVLNSHLSSLSSNKYQFSANLVSLIAPKSLHYLLLITYRSYHLYLQYDQHIPSQIKNKSLNSYFKWFNKFIEPSSIFIRSD